MCCQFTSDKVSLYCIILRICNLLVNSCVGIVLLCEYAGNLYVTNCVGSMPYCGYVCNLPVPGDEGIALDRDT